MASTISLLAEFAAEATRYAINLNGSIDRGQYVDRGGTAVVSRGTWHPDGSYVAIKTMTGAISIDAKAIKKVLREVHVWSKLKHENILPLLGITTDFDATVSLVSKWMESGNAYSYVQDKTIDPRPLVADVARGLCYLHNHPKGKIAHGDLKGANVLISEEGHALLADFGFAYLASSSFCMTASLIPRGCSPNWMSPEIARSFLQGSDCHVTVENDIWALGMTALELFTREVPFHHVRNIIPLAIRILQGPPDRPSGDSTCYRMTDDWWDLCLRCWATERASVKDVLDRIEVIKVRKGWS
ncbi:hypothetical protein ID866_7877 [Astraeus odoratus]|nr:hypothetical protein ID866_7877 [Astraeus odoratus]